MKELVFYTNLASKVVKSYLAKRQTPLKYSDELIGDVASKMMMSHGKFNYNRVSDSYKKSLSYEELETNFLRICAILYLKQKTDRLCRRKSKVTLMSDLTNSIENTIAYEPNEPDHTKTRDDLYRLMDLSQIKQKDKDLIIMYINGIPVKDIAKELKVSSTRIYTRLNNIKETLHNMANHSCKL